MPHIFLILWLQALTHPHPPTHPPTMVFVAYSFSSFPFDSFPLLAFIFVYMVIYLYFHHELPQGRNHVHLSHYPISRAQMSVRVGAQ